MSLEERLARAFLEEHPSEAAQALERLAPEPRAGVVRQAPLAAAMAMRRMAAPAAAEVLSDLSAADAAPLLDRLPEEIAIPLLRRLPPAAADRVIGEVSKERQAVLRRGMHYPEGTAGALMDPAVLALPDDIAAADARVRLRREPHGVLHYLYIVDRDGVLVGVLDIRALMIARPREMVRSLMQENVAHLPAWAPAAAVRTHPGWRRYHTLPVIDDGRRLIGAIRYQTLRRLEDEVDSGRTAQSTAVTVGALGELFHLGIAGLVEGVAATAAPRRPTGRTKGESR